MPLWASALGWLQEETTGAIATAEPRLMSIAINSIAFTSIRGGPAAGQDWGEGFTNLYSD